MDKCSGAYGGGQAGALALSFAFGGAHLGRNALAQGARGMERLMYDLRTWGSVRRARSASEGGLVNVGQSLHHWLAPQRWASIPQGLRNAGFNYLPISAEFNSWMNSSTVVRNIVEVGFRGSVLGIYGAAPTAATGGAGGGGGGGCPRR